MRLLKECLLAEVEKGKTCLIDGVWYLVCHPAGRALPPSNYVALQFKSEPYYTREEFESYRCDEQLDDIVTFRDNLVVITEV